MIKKVHKTKLEPGIKKDDFIRFEGDYWIVSNIDIDLEYFKGVGVLLTNDIPIARLKELVSQWMDEDYTDELEWLDRGIFIYSKLLEEESANDAYKYSLGRLLFENAIHMKRNQATRRKAKALFEEVISLNPNHLKVPLCEYQLGFLNLYQSEWQNGIRHFKHAIESGKLDYFQQLRAYCNLGICYSKNGDDELAQHCIEKAKEIDSKENRFTPEIEMASLQINNDMNQYKPFTLITKDSSKRITKDEAEKISLDYDERGYVVLDCRGYKVIFNGPKDSVKLPGTSTRLLKILMMTNRPFSRGALSEALNSESLGLKLIAEQSIKTYIMNLRNEIAPCFEEQDESPIVTVKGKGYQWITSYPYQIILS